MRGRILATATVLTAIYALAIIVCTVVLWPGEADAFGLAELGDYLAGVFSPLAFGWFVVTVFIQLEELRLQRVEMQKAREERERAGARSSNAQSESAHPTS